MQRVDEEEYSASLQMLKKKNQKNKNRTNITTVV